LKDDKGNVNMRIAMIHTPFWRRAGGERQILRLAIELQHLDHEVEIFTNAINKESYPEFFEKVKVNVIGHPLTEKVPKGLTPQVAVKEIHETIDEKEPSKRHNLRSWMREAVGRQFYTSELPAMFELGRKIPEGFDIINNHNFPTEWAAFLAKKKLKVPVVWMCNEPPYWFFSPEQRSGLRKINWPLFEVLDKIAVDYIDEIMVLSHVSEKYVKNAYNKPSKIVRTGIDVELFQKASGKNIRMKYGLENSFVLLFVGGSRYAKRSDLVRALSILSKKYDNIRLLIDTSREREILTKLSEDLRVQDKVFLLHSTNDYELAGVYAACDVFIYPSSASPWGLVVTEAMAASKPVIVSRQVGTSEIIQDNFNGIIIDKTKPEEIAKQVEKLMNNSKLRTEIGENAYKYVKENLSWERYAKKVEIVFQRTLDKK
jgi:glycosyltransferase involved in cell wall biosynthesis